MAELGRKRSCLKKSGIITQGRKEDEVATLLVSNDKKNVIVNYLFIKLVFVLKLLGLNRCLKGYLKSRINNLPRKSKYKFSVRRCRFIRDISLLSYLILYIYRSPLRIIRVSQ